MKRMAEIIKSTLNTKEVMEYYGIPFNRRGFAKCPFHQEKTASLSVKNDYFKCFGCGQGGGVIDFVMLYFGIGFKDAVIKLNNDFNLGLSDKKPSLSQMAEYRKREREREQKRRIQLREREEYLEIVRAYQYLQKAITKHKPTDQNPDQWHPVFVYAAQNLNRIENWLDENISRLEVRS